MQTRMDFRNFRIRWTSSPLCLCLSVSVSVSLSVSDFTVSDFTTIDTWIFMWPDIEKISNSRIIQSDHGMF